MGPDVLDDGQFGRGQLDAFDPSYTADVLEPRDRVENVGSKEALFDALVADQGLQRLSQWRTLEIPDASDAEVESHVDKATRIARHHDVDLTVATDLMMIALGAAQAWNTTSPSIRNPLSDDDGDDGDGRRRAAYRQSVVTAVAAMVNAATTHAKRETGPTA
ncbi:hypothetical protein [Catenulispora rubra]|uniref:hypothetical protein n=1 Tax=Catenulispora rubra TaxID=280293 RepID=UPI001892466C|nr:hypothetical protein [Catenulispora rubra]